MGRRHQDELVVGEDAFMDTIANLVGIMIILVVIVGARGYTTAKANAQLELKGRLEELSAPVNKTENLDRDLIAQQEQLRQYELELAYRSAERMSLVDRMHYAEQLIDERAEHLDDAQLQDISLDREVSELEKQLADLLRQQGSPELNEQQTIVLQHLPTPMAKTVFGKELHLMLRDNLVTLIPWDELIDTLKEQVRRTVARNTQRERIEDRLGPIDGFMMRYRLIAKSGLMSDGRVAAMGKMVELDKFELDPTPEIVAETIERALSIGGRLRAELTASRSQQTTITVWVYPESFAQFRILKERLFAEGFLCAARPLPSGMKIGASPRGSSSVAQ
jgi:hypothetical protein